jgi:N-methylhydantoinase B/oxoprolinase/acetone carboxylase alpha subunit
MLDPMVVVEVQAGDKLVVEIPGGGGHGATE